MPWCSIVALAAGSFAAAQTATVPGAASLSGTVESSAPYNAAQVFIRNTDKRMLYMVYTNAKRFRAVALFPGNYEISAATKDLKSRRAEAGDQSRRQSEGDADVPAARCRRRSRRSSTPTKAKPRARHESASSRATTRSIRRARDARSQSGPA